VPLSRETAQSPAFDAACRTAAGEAHPHQGAGAQIDYVLGLETEVRPFLKPAASAAYDLLTPVILVGVRKREGLTHLGCRVHQLRGFSQRAPTVHLTPGPDVLLRHRPHYPPRLFRPWPQGREGFKRLVQTWRVAFPDLHEHLEFVLAEGDRALGRFRLTGTHSGPFYGIEPTGRSVDIHGVDVARIVDGQIVEYFYHEDTFGLFRQLGRFPANYSDVAGTIQDASVNA